MRVAYIEANGILTRCYVEGSGPPLLLVHGIGASTDSWMRVIDPLSKYFTVIAPDLMGHGFTGVGDFESGPPQPHMVKHLLGVLDAFGIDKFFLCGSSYGALLALLIYFARKGKVEKLTLLSSASVSMPDEQRLESFRAAKAAALATMANPSLETVRKRLAGMVYDLASVPHALEIMQMNVFAQPHLKRGFEAIMEGKMNLEACREWDVHNRFGEIDCPLLMLWGLNDPRANADRAMALGRQAREAYFVGLPDCAHVPHVEQPEMVTDLMTRFAAGEDFEAHRLR
ncbi:alpha/beta hydrolase [Acidisoma cellulosilytica]|uniref:Alpha/beta hydrolase n=1 Tax=Acidisoma cellulosilyticum TaxID=2802395 RepID=A0A964E5N2_9PROT|nr:alpha/beta hydrolase [Acidisoma cellulosilyticum]MCB8882153.1 alpha/beta hydrolase [Acidisoma cellulosilyticum]